MKVNELSSQESSLFTKKAIVAVQLGHVVI